jgi:hypothetical protein
MLLTELKTLAKSVGVKGYSKMRKAEIIVAIGDVFYDEAIVESHERLMVETAQEIIDEAFPPSIAELDVEYVASLPQKLSKALTGLPMGSARRKDNYLRQNGSERLTGRQRRRLGKKAARKLCNALGI